MTAILHLVQHHPRHHQHLHYHHHYLIVLINCLLSLCKRFWTIQTICEAMANKLKKNLQHSNSTILELMRVNRAGHWMLDIGSKHDHPTNKHEQPLTSQTDLPCSNILSYTALDIQTIMVALFLGRVASMRRLFKKKKASKEAHILSV